MPPVGIDGSDLSFHKNRSVSEQMATGIEDILKEKYGMSIKFDLSGQKEASAQPSPPAPVSRPDGFSGSSSGGFVV